MVVRRFEVVEARDAFFNHHQEHGCNAKCAQCETRKSLWLALVDTSWAWGQPSTGEVSAK